MSLTFNSCRICLEVKSQDTVKSLLVIPIDLGASYFQLYQECIGLNNITINEHLPSYLCFECEKLLLKFRKFRMKCLKTEEILNGLLPIKVESEKYLNFDQVLVQELTEGTEDLEMKEVDFELEVKEENEILSPDLNNGTAAVQIDGEKKTTLNSKSKKIPDEDEPKKRKRTRNTKTEEGITIDKMARQKMKKEHESRREICQQCGKMIAHRYMKLHLMTHIGN
jgi:RNase P subunit RPR2